MPVTAWQLLCPYLCPIHSLTEGGDPRKWGISYHFNAVRAALGPHSVRRIPSVHAGLDHIHPKQFGRLDAYQINARTYRAFYRVCDPSYSAEFEGTR